MPRRRRYEDHDNHEAWAIPYGDLVTLLLAFFVVMYAMSEVNEGKYRVLSDSLTEAFHGTPHTAQPVELGAPRTPSEQLPLTQVNRMITGALPVHRGAVPPAGATPMKSNVTAIASGAATPATVASADAGHGVPGDEASAGAELNQVADQVSQAMAALVAAGEVHVRRTESAVAIDISTDILFGSGVAQLSPAAVQALKRLATALKPWPNAIRVQGHTDNRPIATAAFPSNWELSAARAASVVHLFMDQGVAPERLAVIGYGEYRPTMSNLSANGRNANRRVEVIILGRNAATSPQ